MMPKNLEFPATLFSYKELTAEEYFLNPNNDGSFLYRIEVGKTEDDVFICKIFDNDGDLYCTIYSFRNKVILKKFSFKIINGQCFQPVVNFVIECSGYYTKNVSDYELREPYCHVEDCCGRELENRISEIAQFLNDLFNKTSEELEQCFGLEAK